jgi:hypothetical protein
LTGRTIVQIGILPAPARCPVGHFEFLKIIPCQTDIAGMAGTQPETKHIESGFDHRLTSEEDDELRRLGYLQKMGQLSEPSQVRLVELRLRDQRGRIRKPREFGGL